MMLQLLGESLHCVGMLQLCCSAQLVTAHVHFHCATTVPPSRDLARQALLFLGRFFLPFFVPPILTVFYLIGLCDKEQKKERLRRRLVNAWDIEYNYIVVVIGHSASWLDMTISSSKHSNCMIDKHDDNYIDNKLNH